jgi:hypothetical protein
MSQILPGEAAACDACGTVYCLPAGHQCPSGAGGSEAGIALSLTAPPASEATAAQMPDGTPHPDPFLAVRGWQVLGGIWRRVPAEGGMA